MSQPKSKKGSGNIGAKKRGAKQPTLNSTFSNIVHPSIDFETNNWLGPFNVIINTKGLMHCTLQGEIDTSLNNCYDEMSDVLATLNTLGELNIPSGSIIELGATSDLKGRVSRIDSITAGTIYASVLNAPDQAPHLASLDDDLEDLIPNQSKVAKPVSDSSLCERPLNATDLPKDLLKQLPNLLVDDTIYITPQIATQLGYTPQNYAHIPLDQLTCNNHSHNCTHPVQFAKTQTDFAQHKCDEQYNEDHVLSLSLPFHKQVYIRIAQLPRVLATSSVVNASNAVLDQLIQQRQDEAVSSQPKSEKDRVELNEALEKQLHLSNNLFFKEPSSQLRVAQRGVFYLLPSLNNFPLNVAHDILHRYFTTPLRHQVNDYIRGRRLHVGMVFAVPITPDEEDRLYHQSLEEKAEDHDEENLATVPEAYFPCDCLYFYVAELECDKNVYTAMDEAHVPLYNKDDDYVNSGNHNNFLTCRLNRRISPSINDARAMVGLNKLDRTDGTNAKQYAFSTEENVDVHRTTSYMLVDGYNTDVKVIGFNLTCLRPSLYQSLYQTMVNNTSQYTKLYQLALKHALFVEYQSKQFTLTENNELVEKIPEDGGNNSEDSITEKGGKSKSLLSLIHKYQTLLFSIPSLDNILMRGYGSAFSALVESVLPVFYSEHTYILPLIQSTHTKNNKATLLRALSNLIHLDYIEIDTDQCEGLMSEGDIQYLGSVMSAIVNIRNIGVDTVIPPLPKRSPGLVNNIFILTASCADVPKHILATDIINLPLPSPTPRSRIYLFELLSRMTYNNCGGKNDVYTEHNRLIFNDISCQQLSALNVCSYVGLTGYTNAAAQSVSLLAQAILIKSINQFKHDKEMYIQAHTKNQDLLITCHCHVLTSMLQHNNVASGIPNVSWKDIGAAGGIRKELMQLIKPKSSKGSSAGSDLGNATFSLQRRGVLLYGPPGSGKTLVAKALAGESGIGFVTANAGEILSMYIGESEKKIRDLFINARNSAPCVLFLDEIDSLAPSKTNAGDSGGGGVMQRVVSQLLLEIDALNDDGIDVFIVGATNRPELLDLSLLRPGRIDRSIYVGISQTVDDQLQILKALTRKFKFGPKVNLRKILEAYCQSRPLTGADFFALASTTMTLAIMDAVNNVEREKQGEVVNQDEDDYDIEDDPEPIIPKTKVGDKIGNLDNVANSSMINKTLSAAGMMGGGSGMPVASMPTDNNTTAPATTTNNMLSEFGGDLFGTQTKPKKKIDIYGFGKKETTPTPLVETPAETTVQTTDLAPLAAPKRKKKKDSMFDGILDFGIPIDEPAIDEPAVVETPAAPNDTTPAPSPVTEAPKKKKKKKLLSDGILDFGIPMDDIVEEASVEAPTVDEPRTVEKPALPVEEASVEALTVDEPRTVEKPALPVEESAVEEVSEAIVNEEVPFSIVEVNEDSAAVDAVPINEEDIPLEIPEPESNPPQKTRLPLIPRRSSQYTFASHKPISIKLSSQKIAAAALAGRRSEPDPDPDLVKEHIDEDFDEDCDEDNLIEDFDEDCDYYDEDDIYADEDEDDDDGYAYIPPPSYAGRQLASLYDSEYHSDQDDEDDDEELSPDVDENNMVYQFAEESSDDDDSDLEFSDDEEYYYSSDDDNEDDEDNEQEDEKNNPLVEEQKREEVAQSVAYRGVIVYQKHFIQAAKKLTPSLSQQELDHYAKIRQQFSSKRQKK